MCNLQRLLSFFNYSMLMSSPISCKFFTFRFHWGLQWNFLLPPHNMKPVRRAQLAAVPFVKYFHTDARLWVMLCCQTLIAALLLHYNWDMSRGDMHIWMCALKASGVNYGACLCASLLVPLDGVQCNGSGLLHVLPQQHLSVCSIQIGHFNSGRPRVCPVKLIMDPVDSQSP